MPFDSLTLVLSMDSLVWKGLFFINILGRFTQVVYRSCELYVICEGFVLDIWGESSFGSFLF